MPATPNNTPTRIRGEREQPTKGPLSEKTTIQTQTRVTKTTSPTSHSKPFRISKEKLQELQAVGQNIHEDSYETQQKVLRSHIDPAARSIWRGNDTLSLLMVRIVRLEEHFRDQGGVEARLRDEYARAARWHDNREFWDGGWRREADPTTLEGSEDDETEEDRVWRLWRES